MMKTLSFRDIFRRGCTARGITGVLGVSVLLFFASCTAGSSQEPLQGRLRPDATAESAPAGAERFQGPLTVMTLNLAHGRGTAFSQLLQTGAATRENLTRVAGLLKTHAADIVALQEADGPSLWSGDMDHVALLAVGAGYNWHARATHVSYWLATYGTAMLSREPFADAFGHTFQPSPPTFNKGFLLGQFHWQPDPNSNTVLKIDVLSVHLDFSRKSVRESQIEEMMQLMAGRNHPTIILGDFNREWFADGSVVKRLAERAGLIVYQPTARNLGTFFDGKKRFDWILLSRDLTFTRYAVVPDVVSDHLAVIAEINWVGSFVPIAAPTP